MVLVLVKLVLMLHLEPNFSDQPSCSTSLWLLFRTYRLCALTSGCTAKFHIGNKHLLLAQIRYEIFLHTGMVYSKVIQESSTWGPRRRILGRCAVAPR